MIKAKMRDGNGRKALYNYRQKWLDADAKRIEAEMDLAFARAGILRRDLKDKL